MWHPLMVVGSGNFRRGLPCHGESPLPSFDPLRLSPHLCGFEAPRVLSCGSGHGAMRENFFLDDGAYSAVKVRATGRRSTEGGSRKVRGEEQRTEGK